MALNKPNWDIIRANTLTCFIFIIWHHSVWWNYRQCRCRWQRAWDTIATTTTTSNREEIKREMIQTCTQKTRQQKRNLLHLIHSMSFIQCAWIILGLHNATTAAADFFSFRIKCAILEPRIGFHCELMYIYVIRLYIDSDVKKRHTEIGIEIEQKCINVYIHLYMCLLTSISKMGLNSTKLMYSRWKDDFKQTATITTMAVCCRRQCRRWRWAKK